jgi:ribonuclease G
LNRKVWLPSGGYLIIEQTEALTTFDVNTGKFVGKLSLRDTVLKTNLEAVTEIASQLRLRNIGGIIVLDFIDMDEEEDREKVFGQLEKTLAADKAKVNVLKISELGLVQMTRKRTSESLEQSLTEECPHCDGRGNTRSLRTIALDLIRDIERFALQTGNRKITVHLREAVKHILFEEDRDYYKQVCNKLNLDVELRVFGLNDAELRRPPYEIH